MKLLAEVVGVLFAAAAIVSLLRAGDASLPWRSSVGVVVVVVAGLLFFSNIWGADNALRASTRADAHVGAQAAEVAAGAATNTAFLAWARAQIVGGHGARTFWLAPVTDTSDPLTYQWSTFELLPARETDAVAQANWVVLYGVKPAAVDYDRATFARLIVYAPGYALAERTNVG